MTKTDLRFKRGACRLRSAIPAFRTEKISEHQHAREAYRRLRLRSRRLYEREGDLNRLRQYLQRWWQWLHGGLDRLVCRKGGLQRLIRHILSHLHIPRPRCRDALVGSLRLLSPSPFILQRRRDRWVRRYDGHARPRLARRALPGLEAALSSSGLVHLVGNWCLALIWVLRDLGRPRAARRP